MEIDIGDIQMQIQSSIETCREMIEHLGEERFYFNEEQISLEGEKTKKKYSLGDDIEIIIRKVDFKKRQAYFSLFKKEASSGFEPL